MAPTKVPAVKKGSVIRLNCAQHPGVAQSDDSDFSEGLTSTNMPKEVHISAFSKADLASQPMSSSFAVVTSPISETPSWAQTKGAFSATFRVASRTAPDTGQSASLFSLTTSMDLDDCESKFDVDSNCNGRSQQKNCLNDSPFFKSLVLPRSQSDDTNPIDANHGPTSALLERSRTLDPHTLASGKSEILHSESSAPKFAFPTFQQAQLKSIGMANSAFSLPSTPLKDRPAIADAIKPLANHSHLKSTSRTKDIKDSDSASTAFARPSGNLSHNVLSEPQVSGSYFPPVKRTQDPKDSKIPDIFSDVNISDFTPGCAESQNMYFPSQSQESSSTSSLSVVTDPQRVEPVESQFASSTDVVSSAETSVNLVTSANALQFTAPLAFLPMHALLPGQTHIALVMPVTPAQGQLSPFGAPIDSPFVPEAILPSATSQTSPFSRANASSIHSTFSIGNTNSPFTVADPSLLGCSRSMDSGTSNISPFASSINDKSHAAQAPSTSILRPSPFGSHNTSSPTGPQTSRKAKVAAKILESKAHTPLQKRLESVVAALERHERRALSNKVKGKEAAIDLPTSLPIGISGDEGGVDIGIFCYAHTGNSPVYEPDPMRTLLLVNLPAEQRTTKFISDWYRPMGFPSPTHVEVDLHNSKALVEFATIKQAVRAFMSPMIEGNAGTFDNIRAAWLDGWKRVSSDELKRLATSLS